MPSIFDHIHNGNIEEVRNYINQGKNIEIRSSNDRTLLMKAVICNNPKIVKLLLDNGADLNSIGGEFDRTPLVMAVSVDNIQIFKLLIKYGANINEENLMKRACNFRSFKIAKYLQETFNMPINSKKCSDEVEAIRTNVNREFENFLKLSKLKTHYPHAGNNPKIDKRIKIDIGLEDDETLPEKDRYMNTINKKYGPLKEVSENP